MTKNFADNYNSTNDSVALNQRIFLKEESVRGTISLPLATDFFYQLTGTSVDFSQPVESSPHKTGRHHASVIKQKTVTQWKLPTFFNIDTSLGSAGTAEIDPAMRVLWKSLLGREQTSPNLTYDTATDPSTTFTIFENLDIVGKQAPGCYVEAGNASFPGDGQAKIEWSGMAKTMYEVGIGKSVTANAANAITVATGEGKRFPIGGKVMVIKANGTTRSTDTATGTARTVTAVAGDVVTVDGAPLTDSDGTSTPVYLCFYEPAEPHTAINNPVTGLVGSITVTGISQTCIRKLDLAMTNNHEPENFCFGKDGLGDKIFTPGGRFTAAVSMDVNLDKALVGYLNDLRSFAGVSITLILGDTAGRYMRVDLAKVIFNVPPISVPDTGTIPISMSGNAYESANNAADEVVVQFK